MLLNLLLSRNPSIQIFDFDIKDMIKEEKMSQQENYVDAMVKKAVGEEGKRREGLMDVKLNVLHDVVNGMLDFKLEGEPGVEISGDDFVAMVKDAEYILNMRDGNLDERIKELLKNEMIAGKLKKLIKEKGGANNIKEG